MILSRQVTRRVARELRPTACVNRPGAAGTPPGHGHGRGTSPAYKPLSQGGGQATVHASGTSPAGPHQAAPGRHTKEGSS